MVCLQILCHCLANMRHMIDNGAKMLFHVVFLRCARIHGRGFLLLQSFERQASKVKIPWVFSFQLKPLD